MGEACTGSWRVAWSGVSGIIRFVNNFIPQTPCLHPFDGQEIVQAGTEAIADSIFGTPMGAREMLHGHFGHGKPVHPGERGEKPVHVVEQGNAFDNRPPENFQ